MQMADIAEGIHIDPRKLTHYALNPASPVGKHKAVLFERLLGFTRENYLILLARLEEAAMRAEVTPHNEDKYGMRYTADMLIQGTEGREAVVRTGWILPHGSKDAHLTTLYVKR